MPPVTYSINGLWPDKDGVQGRRGGNHNIPFIDVSTELSKWISEAKFLFERASKCLAAALEKQTKNEGVMPSNVNNILNGILGKDHNPADCRAIITMFDEIASLKKVGLKEQHVLLFRFRTHHADTVGLITEGELGTELPVALTRIGGVFRPKLSNGAEFTADKSMYKSTSKITDLKNDPYAQCTYNTTEALNLQQGQTGSKFDWNDIIINEDQWKMNSSPTQNMRPPGTLNQWRKLTGATDWSKNQLLGKSLLGQGEIAIVTVMHEILHSIALSRPLESHGKVNGRSANGLVRVLQLAKNEGHIASMQNPDSLVYLAICLTMPWYIWWSSPDEFDGSCRANTPVNPSSSERQYVPASKWEPKCENLTPTEKSNEISSMGPYCFKYLGSLGGSFDVVSSLDSIRS